MAFTSNRYLNSKRDHSTGRRKIQIDLQLNVDHESRASREHGNETVSYSPEPLPLTEGILCQLSSLGSAL